MHELHFSPSSVAKQRILKTFSKQRVLLVPTKHLPSLAPPGNAFVCPCLISSHEDEAEMVAFVGGTVVFWKTPGEEVRGVGAQHIFFRYPCRKLQCSSSKQPPSAKEATDSHVPSVIDGI